MAKQGRKQTNGRLPRYLVKSAAPGCASKKASGDAATAFVPSQQAENAPELVSRLELQRGHSMRKTEQNDGAAKNDQSIEDVIDFDNASSMQLHQPQYKVQRQPVVAEMSPHARELFDRLLHVAKRLYKKSAYVVLQDCDEFEPTPNGAILPQASDPALIRRKILPDLLASGKLYGCKVQGARGQFGLVATRDLEPWTPITVDCGSIWSVDKHDEWLQTSKNPLTALSSTTVPMELFQDFFSKSAWKKLHNKVESTSFVVDCFSAGNEVVHLDDAGWASAGKDVDETVAHANVDAFAVLNLKGEGFLSIVYCVNRTVSKGTELTMNWGNWDQISSYLLPSQTFLSHVAQRELDEVLQQLRVEDRLPDARQFDQVMQECPSPDESTRFRPLDAETAEEEAEKESSPGILTFLYHAVFQGAPPADSKKRKLASQPVDDLFSIGIDITLDRTVRPFDTRMLDEDICHELDVRKFDYPVDIKVEAMLHENILDRVEVHEITDFRNPAKLFTLPGQKAYGVFAKRDYAVDDPVLCYGGYLMNKDNTLDELDAYVFEVDHQFMEHDLLINGEFAVAGKINDPIALGGTAKRRSNLTSFAMYDHELRNPLVVFYASRPIRAGDELLYSYGAAYWREMWKVMMFDHSHFISKTNYVTEQLRQFLSSKAEKTEDSTASTSTTSA